MSNPWLTQWQIDQSRKNGWSGNFDWADWLAFLILIGLPVLGLFVMGLMAWYKS